MKNKILGAAVALVLGAGATMITVIPANAAEECRTESVLVTPAVPATPDTYKDVENPDYIPAIPAVEEVKELRPVKDAVPAVYETVIVIPAIPAQAEEGYTRYQYQKQVKGVIQERKNANSAWKDKGTFDWQWYANVSLKWSDRSVDVLESGDHSSAFAQQGNSRKVSTNYRYVKNGVTEYVKTKDAVPGVPAVTEQRLVTEAQDAVYEWVVVVEGKPEVPAQGEPTISVVDVPGAPGTPAVYEDRQVGDCDEPPVKPDDPEFPLIPPHVTPEPDVPQPTAIVPQPSAPVLASTGTNDVIAGIVVGGILLVIGALAITLKTERDENRPK